MKQPFDLEKLMTFHLAGGKALTLDEWDYVSHTITFNDLPAGGFWLTYFLCNYFVRDLIVSTPEEVYYHLHKNTNEYKGWIILHSALVHQLGSSLNISVAGGDPLHRGQIHLESDLVYDFRNCPIYFTENYICPTIHIGVNNYTPVTGCIWYYTLILGIGYNHARL